MLFMAIVYFLLTQIQLRFLLLGLLTVWAVSCQSVGAQETVNKAASSGTASDLPPTPKGMQVEYSAPPRILLAKSQLGDWDTIDFAGGGEASVASHTLEIGIGEGLTGVFWDGDDLPTNNYDLNMQARRTEGIDFFCGPVFPVNDSHCCLIVGGWAGATVGLSSIDGKDASNNETTKLMDFKNNRWYDIRVRVLPDRIIVWIDNECVIYQNITGKKISLRGDTELCTPMGLCTFQTKAEIRKLTLQRIGKPAKSTELPKPLSQPPK